MADYTLFKLRGDTRANWLAANPILNNRELAMETDTMRFKVGDGLATYSQLPYGRNTGEYLNFYNITAFIPLPAGYYYTHEEAISKVVVNERCKGLIVTYEVSSGVWVTERFIGTDVANWGVLANWEKVPDAGDIEGIDLSILNLQNRNITAGNGLTGGGDLSADRTINVAASDDSIVVAADGIKVDTQNLLTSTSATKPLAANQGKVLDEKITQIGAELNQAESTLNQNIQTAKQEAIQSSNNYTDNKSIEILPESVTPSKLSPETLALLNSGGAITNLADGEDLENVGNVIKFKDKSYEPSNYSGLAKKYLRKNIVGGVNILDQSMINDANTIYIIQYDYDLNATTINIQNNCVLDFQGGSLKNGTIVFNNTYLCGAPSIFSNYDGLIKNEIINIKWFGIKGDDDGNNNGTDDTLLMQRIFNYASKYGNDILLPVGNYKITSPLRIIETEENGSFSRKKWFKIIGQGYSSWDNIYEGSCLVGYNIPYGRGVLELLGNSNGAASQGSIENICIRSTDSSNSLNSCSLFVGDCWFFNAKKVKIIGMNGLKTRCGSSIDSHSSYAMIATKFEQCQFEAISNRGFSVYPEYIESGYTSGYDNLQFDCCTFRGLSLIVSVTIMFQNCLWWVNPRRDIITYNSGVLNGYTVDFSTSLWIAGALNAHINKGYFEDYRQGIMIKPIGGFGINSIVIENTEMNSLSNYLDESNNNYKADVAIIIKPNDYDNNVGFVNCVNIKNNFLNDESGGFQDVVIRNEKAITLNITNNVVGNDPNKKLRYVDLYSKIFHIVDIGNSQGCDTKIIEFNILLQNYVSYGFLYDTLINNYTVTRRSRIQRITIISDRILQSPWCNLSISKNGTYIHSSDFTNKSDLNYQENSCSVYIWEKKMHVESPAIYESGDKLSFDTYITDINSLDIGAKIKIIAEISC